MPDPMNPLDVGRLIRRRGLPEPPKAAEAVTEVRSDGALTIDHVLPTHTSFTLAAVVVQWRYRMSYTEADQFHRFLAENEQYIAESCETLMRGVHYRGTFMGISGQRALHTTVWGYDSSDGHKEWSKVTADRTSRFYQVICDLRAYWTSDPGSTQETFGAAAGIDLGKDGFSAITVDAEKRRPHRP